jgi:hypothetical protein
MRVARHIAEVLDRFSDLNDGRRPRTGYVIYAGSYVSNSAGIECLHRLCGELNARGYPAFAVGGNVAAPHLDAPMVDMETAKSLCVDGFSAIYPETIHGNPFDATNVVRWVLNRPRLLGGDRVYADSERVYTYSDVFSPYIENRIAGKLYMPTIDERLFFCHDNDIAERSLECYYIGKSEWKDGIVSSADACEITRENPRKSELGKLFRSAKVFYCFDNSTILIYEALFCGCPVVVIPDGTHTKSDFEQLELGTTGIVWGVGESAATPVDVSALQNRYAKVKQQFVEQLVRMVSDSQANAAADVDWHGLASRHSSHDWMKRGRRIPITFVRQLDRYSRYAERIVRNGRRYCLKQLRERFALRDALRNPDKYFYRDGRDFSTRQFECIASRHCVETRVLDRGDIFEITQSTPAKEIGKLFRASRRYYAFRRSDPLVRCALLCGCPVTVIGKRDRTEQIDPLPPTAAALRQRLCLRGSRRDFLGGGKPSKSPSASDQRQLTCVP